MNKDILNELLYALVVEKNKCTSSECSYDVLDKMKLHLESYLIEHPNDGEVLTKLALTVLNPPYADDEAAMRYLEKAITIDPTNLDRVLLLAYINQLNRTTKIDVLGMLENIKPSNAQEQAMIFYAQASYYESIDEKRYVELLKKSIDYYDGFVWPCVDLGKFYRYCENYEAAYSYFKKALNNVHGIFRKGDLYHIVDLKEFVNECVKGDIISDANLKIIQHYVDECSDCLPDFSSVMPC